MDEFDDGRLRALLPSLRRFARSLTGDTANADDLVQSVFAVSVGSLEESSSNC